MFNRHIVFFVVGLTGPSVLAIHNGVDVPTSRVPYMAVLFDERTGTLFCGGFIFSQTWILTAASCLNDRKPTETLIRLAAKFTDDSHMTMGALMFQFHPEYLHNRKKNPNNIALVKSLAQIEMSPGLTAPIQLPYLLEWLPPGTICFFSGLGIQKPGESLSTRRHLRLLNMKILDDEQCRAEFGDWYVSPNFCASALTTAKGDVCEGDFGGPLVCEGTRLGLVAYGLATRSNGNCRDNKPVLFTDIGLKRNWVYKVTGM